MKKDPKITIIICTYNAWYLLKNLLRSIENQTYTNYTILINDDKRSSDNLEAKLKKHYPDLDYRIIYENESIGQARKNASVYAKTKYLVHLDADFILEKDVLGQCIKLCEVECADAVIIPERVIGTGFWTKCRVFEKELYLGDDMIESPRFFKTEKYKSVGGHDRSLSMLEEKDVDLRFKSAGYKIERSSSFILHNERKITLRNTFRRKFFWAQSALKFMKKYPRFSFIHGLFFLRPSYLRNWKKIISNPILSSGLFILKTTEGIAFVFGMLYNKVFRTSVKYKN